MIRGEIPVENDLCGTIAGEETTETDSQTNDTSAIDGGARRKKREAGTTAIPTSVLIAVLNKNDVKTAIQAVRINSVISLWK